jgi:hypothetical protein
MVRPDARSNASGAQVCEHTGCAGSSCPTIPRFVDKLRDGVRVHVNPPAHAIVLSVDEKSLRDVRWRIALRFRPPTYRLDEARFPISAARTVSSNFLAGSNRVNSPERRKKSSLGYG